MKKILFISEKHVKESSIIEANVDSKIISNAILEVQKLELVNIIGKKKYKDIEDMIVMLSLDANAVVDTDLKHLLDEYIKDFLVYGTLVYAFVPINFKFTNKGINKKSDSAAVASNKEELEYVKKHYQSKFDSYKLNLIEEVNGCETNSSSTGTSFSTGWYLSRASNIATDFEKYSNKLKL